jgi:hypothetical protein
MPTKDEGFLDPASATVHFVFSRLPLSKYSVGGKKYRAGPGYDSATHCSSVSHEPSACLLSMPIVLPLLYMTSVRMIYVLRPER